MSVRERHAWFPHLYPSSVHMAKPVKCRSCGISARKFKTAVTVKASVVGLNSKTANMVAWEFWYVKGKSMFSWTVPPCLGRQVQR